MYPLQRLEHLPLLPSASHKLCLQCFAAVGWEVELESTGVRL